MYKLVEFRNGTRLTEKPNKTIVGQQTFYYKRNEIKLYTYSDGTAFVYFPLLGIKYQYGSTKEAKDDINDFITGRQNKSLFGV